MSSDIVERLREVPTIGHDAGCVIEAAGAIESLRQWKREAIEVLDEWDETWIAADKPGPLGKSKAQGVKKLVESLRQRVKELEKYQREAIHLRNVVSLLDDELAALKAGQGEPVAVVDVETVDVYSNYINWLTEDLPSQGTKLYTSAPTIPEGLLDELEKWREFGRALGYAGINNMTLPAAPKPEER